jgi:hypothetical protein
MELLLTIEHSLFRGVNNPAASTVLARRSIQRSLKALVDSGAIKRAGRYLVVRDAIALGQQARRERLSIGYSSNAPLKLGAGGRKA